MVNKSNDTSLYVFKMPECTKSFSCTLLMMSYTSSLTATFLKLPKGPSLWPVYNLIWQQKICTTTKKVTMKDGLNRHLIINKKAAWL